VKVYFKTRRLNYITSFTISQEDKKTRRLNYITSFTISQYFEPATQPVSGIFERATWQP